MGQWQSRCLEGMILQPKSTEAKYVKARNYDLLIENV